MKKTYKTKYEYWRERCELAENFINYVIDDEIAYPEETEAYKKWKQFKTK